MEEEEEELQQSVKMEDTRKTWPTKSTKQGSYGPTEFEGSNTEPTWVYIRSCVCVVVAEYWVPVG